MFVIGDVHGCYDTLVKLLEQLPKDAELCFVGDLIDRGPKSKEVVDFVKDNGYPCVKGNHEDMLVAAIMDEGYSPEFWMRNGGWPTLLSFGRIPDETYVTWFVNLPDIIQIHDNVFVSHANAAAGKDVKWNRDLNSKFANGAMNIFGHTPVRDAVIDDTLICVDTGCVNGGCLSAYDTNTGRVYIQKCVDVVRK